MSHRSLDTSEDAAARQMDALRRMTPAGRVKIALDLSDAVRSIQIDGTLARHPDWTAEEAARHVADAMLGRHAIDG